MQGEHGRHKLQVRAWATAVTLALTLVIGASAQAKPIPVSLTSTSTPVPRSYFGLSVESNELPTYELGGALFDRFLSLVRPQDGSPFLLRIGGRSSDDAWWDTTPSHQPHWVFELDDTWLSQVGELARRDQLGVMLDLNLAVHSPTMATQFAQAAVSALRSHLKALGFGNEPDLYHQQRGLQRERAPSTLASTPSDWTDTYTSDAYRNDWSTYAHAITQAAPGVPLQGPDTTSSSPSWVAALTGLGRVGPRLITMHRYPFSSCYPPTSRWYPTIAGLLTQNAVAGLGQRLRTAQEIAQANHLPLRITELNSMSCGGPPHIANSFATALWTPDVLFELMKAGLVGVNWHIRPELRNAPFHLGPHGFVPEPELYGLIMFADMIGPRARLVSVQAPAPFGDHLKVWAVHSSTGTRVLFINKQRAPVTVQLTKKSNWGRTARVMSLRAPSVSAQTGVKLGGQTLGPNVRWTGHQTIAKVRSQQGSYRLRLPGYSAELVRISAP